ncbi:MAG TPA: phospho-N-acetylmuramoyl-pentapeptide-transferase [Candidatus Acidoferrum sp.]|nr:phospho-N-acetylmuramoyl-pentapeptide-transferase [Candidatus Acidoferrum sp.]
MSKLLIPLTAFALTAGTLPFLIPFLRRLKFGQVIREDGPVWHQGKAGTPTMGGIAFMLGITGAILAGMLSFGDVSALLCALCALSFGLVGFADDYIKVVKKRNLGLSARQKITLHILAGCAYIAAMTSAGLTSTSVAIPFTGYGVELGMLYYPLALFVVVGAVNSVNLTDGLDGLATGVTLPVAVLFMGIAWRLGADGLWLPASALFGGLLGFLPYNRKPAKVFMGDTGSMYLGGMVTALAFAAGMPMLLVICGGVYVAEALSDILQVGYFKATGGKRLLRMAPLHHHFEMSGWGENRIVIRFSLISTLLCILAWLGYAGFYAI